MRYTHTHNVCVFMCMVGESHGLVCILLYVFLHVKATVLFSNALVPTYVCAMDRVHTVHTEILALDYVQLHGVTSLTTKSEF